MWFIAQRYIQGIMGIAMAGCLMAGCGNRTNTIDQMAYKTQKEALTEKYNKIPQEEILQQETGRAVYSELQMRYNSHLINLKLAIEKDSARMVVVILTPEVGKASTYANRYGIPFIQKSCEDMSIDCINLTDSLIAHEDNKIAQVSDEGYWTKAGNELLAALFVPIIKQYDTLSSTYIMPKDTTTLMGDLQPNKDATITTDATLKYVLHSNAQGFRMEHNLTFPKTKQTFLFLGDGQVMTPFSNNEDIWTSLLQKHFPNKEIVNAGITHYTVEDYFSLYTQKARHCNPDVVFVCTNGTDVLELYFTYRNKYSRTEKIYRPSDIEQKFYHAIFAQ